MGLPLVVLLPMLTARVFPFVAPNEEPKWGIFVCCGLSMGLAAAWSWWTRQQREHALEITPTGVLILLFYMLLGLGVFVGPNPIEGLIRYVFWIVSLTVLLLATWAIRKQRRWLEGLNWATGIAGFVFSLGYWRGYVLDFGTPGYNVSVLFSPVGHVNFTGDVLVILLPAMIWMLAASMNPVLRLITWFSVFTSATLLLVAASRGALGGLLVGIIFLTLIAGRHGWRGNLSLRSTGALWWALSALLVAVIVDMNLPYHYRELVRLSDTVEAAVDLHAVKHLTPYVAQPPFADFWAASYPVLTDRTPIFASTTAMAMDAPWLGQGTGNFPFVYPAWSNRFPDFRDALSGARTFTTNPHNVILQLASQNGLVAASVFMFLLLLLWWRLLMSVWREWHAWHAAGLTAVTAAVFDAMFNHVFVNPASMFVFALFAGAWWGSLQPAGWLSKPLCKFSLSATRPLAITLAVVTVVLAIWPLRWVVSEWHVGQAMAHARDIDVARAEFAKAYALDPYNFRAVFGMAQTSYMAGQFDQAVMYLLDFEAIYPYNPPALNMLGAAYLMIGDRNNAARAFARALKILPGFRMAEQNLMRLRTLKDHASQPASDRGHLP